MIEVDLRTQFALIAHLLPWPGSQTVDGVHNAIHQQIGSDLTQWAAKVLSR
jgi:hypothetical protein